MTSQLWRGAKIKRLTNRWRRYATSERKLHEQTTNPDSKARAYGAWLAYRICVKELERMAKDGV